MYLEFSRPVSSRTIKRAQRRVKTRETEVNEVCGAVVRDHLTLSLKDC